MAVQIPFRMLDCLENQEEMDVMAHLDLWAHQELVSLAHHPQLCLTYIYRNRMFIVNSLLYF